jgi:hypothetical protein
LVSQVVILKTGSDGNMRIAPNQSIAVVLLTNIMIFFAPLMIYNITRMIQCARSEDLISDAIKPFVKRFTVFVILSLSSVAMALIV